MDINRNNGSTSLPYLAIFKRNPKEFMRHCVTVDEAWIHMDNKDQGNRRNSGLHPAKLLPRRWRLSYRSERWWWNTAKNYTTNILCIFKETQPTSLQIIQINRNLENLHQRIHPHLPAEWNAIHFGILRA